MTSPIPGVKHVLPVISGKGGVGKSTVAVQLALALQMSEGNPKVGLLDADIYGPSIALMTGTQQESPQVSEDRFVPVLRYGLHTLSIAHLVPKDQAMVWRGPMVTSALMQLLFQTHWPDLDYLIIDMPPGTGDIQLTLAQKVPVTAALVVTTPQEVALIDARKAIAMLKKVNIPVMGIVENMSTHQCTHCGHVDALFGQGGATRLAEEEGVELLAQLPLVREIREGLDLGVPVLVSDPKGATSAPYRALARAVAEYLGNVQKKPASVFPKIVIE